TTSLSFRVVEVNFSGTPFTDTIAAAVGYANDAGMRASLVVDPVPAPTATGANTPTICPRCKSTSSGSGTDNSAGTGSNDSTTGASAGSPIDLATGNLWISHRDYTLPGARGGLDLTRTWNSVWPLLAPANPVGMFGNGWTSSYEEVLQRVTIYTID